MLLVHQAGAVKVGEVVRYTVTYTPSSDRILPSPSHLHVKIKNTSAIPLRAAYLHGPYTLHVSAYPSAFNPNQKFESHREYGVPVFEPNLKAGGHWHAKLVVPEHIRESGEKANTKRNIDGSPKTVKWIIEVASQILFSTSASVNYELLIGRDLRSLEIGFAAVAGKGYGEPGQIQDFKQTQHPSTGRQAQPRGVYSRAIDLVVEDTATLWDKPALPKWEFDSGGQATGGKDGVEKQRKKRKLHVVILTHGLHSNTGADLLYMKESIDQTVRQVQEVNRERREASRERRRKKSGTGDGKAPQKQLDPGTDQTRAEDENENEESDDEQVIVRGFPGNSVRTERGIQYLGKRLAKYILTMTYPDQPFLPTSKSITKSFTESFSSATSKISKPGTPAHSGSSVQLIPPKHDDLAYTFTSISFIGHSLGGLVQTYAIAYIQKHSPNFFNSIKPVNFVALASPFLGLSNENPLYVKFALDFGLVGRTGQDLGLTWRAPNVARTGWSAMISGFGSNGTQEQPRQEDPRAKPLLRILPSGPAHQVLKMFRNRTVYSNVVNDGIVPLRTSCLLFLDWGGLGKVENARRENGLIGTMAAFGWAELTGANSTSHRPSTARSEDDEDPLGEGRESHRSTQGGDRRKSRIPEPAPRAIPSSDTQDPQDHQFLSLDKGREGHEHNPESVPNVPNVGEDVEDSAWKAYTLPNNPLTDFINFFRPGLGKFQSSSSQKVSNKAAKTYQRAQTVKQDPNEAHDDAGDRSSEEHSKSISTSNTTPGTARGESFLEDPNSAPPPKTSIFDAAGDILNPPLPPESWLIDPSKRHRTIFHDRIYHPDDIPLPPPRRPKLPRSISSNGSLRANARSQSVGDLPVDSSGMKVEEKIARAYHNEMSWRKVLVRLEPDAHNNMIVRRIFANAYGWDVVKHLCDTHFGDTFAANTRDEFGDRQDHAWPLESQSTTLGSQFDGQGSVRKPQSTTELREEYDQLADLEAANEARESLTSSIKIPTPRSSRSQDSAVWNDSILDDDGDEADESDDEVHGAFESFQRFWSRSPKPDGKSRADRQAGAQDAQPSVQAQQRQTEKEKQGTSESKIDEHLTLSPQETQIHRGLGVFKPEPVVQSTFDGDAIDSLSAEEARPSKLSENSTGNQSPFELGLKKPPEAHITAAISPTELKREMTRETSVSEHVAKVGLASKDAQRS